MTWGSPMDRFRRRDKEFLPEAGVPQRLRGYSDDAPILKLKLPLHDAKLSNTSWLTKVRHVFTYCVFVSLAMVCSNGCGYLLRCLQLLNIGSYRARSLIWITKFIYSQSILSQIGPSRSWHGSTTSHAQAR